jgi:thiol:disulfide interchange protein DsbA
MIKKIWIAGLVVSLWFSMSTSAQEFIEDVNYVRLSKPHAVQTGEKIEVLELFWYHCPHCFHLEPFLNRWLKNTADYIEYVRLPAILTNSWELDARVFYTFEALGITEVMHTAYFDAIHKDRKPFVTEEQVAAWAGEYGIERQDFLDTFFNSFYVNSKVETARKLTGSYETDGVPTIIIDGKYRTKVSLAGGHDELIDLINYLAAVAQEERP